MQNESLFTPMVKENRLNPLLKWAGGKEKELRYIVPNIPLQFDRYLEPFIGGGAVYFTINCQTMHINDLSPELIDLYKFVQKGSDNFFEYLYMIEKSWSSLSNLIVTSKDELTNLYSNYSNGIISIEKLNNEVAQFGQKHSNELNGIFSTSVNLDLNNFLKEIIKNITNKFQRMKVIEHEQKRGNLSQSDILDNCESALKSGYYMHFRYIFNHKQKYNLTPELYTAIFYFIREFCYASMFRYNSKGEFNVPYGGIQYNKKDFRKKIDNLRSTEYKNHLGKTKIWNLDFEEFFAQTSPNKNDFIFLDPPYDSEFSTYANNSFTQDDQIRLANLLKKADSKFMLVIKSTPFIFQLYTSSGFFMSSFDKKYLVSFQGRNDQNADHLLITNYPQYQPKGEK